VQRVAQIEQHSAAE